MMLMLGTAFAEEATLIPGRTLRVSFAPASFGFQVQKWDWEGVSNEKVFALGMGLGLEYGPSGWINFQLLWFPGINVFSSIPGGKYGLMTDMFLGTKIGILGKGALVESEKLRFSLSPGMKMPLGGFNASGKANTLREPDQHLWGSALRLYFDYIASPWFFVNTYLEGIFYPLQWSYNPLFKTNLVNHFLDITTEVKMHFQFALKKGIVLKTGIPLTFFAAPMMNSRDSNAKDSQLCFGSGLYFGMVFPKLIDFTIRYHAPIVGKNTEPVHRIDLLFGFTIPLFRQETVHD